VSGAFADRARAALADHQLHVALDRTTAQFGLRRSAALATLPDADTVREEVLRRVVASFAPEENP
jgi:hypothetical protein